MTREWPVKLFGDVPILTHDNLAIINDTLGDGWHYRVGLLKFIWVNSNEEGFRDQIGKWAVTEIIKGDKEWDSVKDQTITPVKFMKFDGIPNTRPWFFLAKVTEHADDV